MATDTVSETIADYALKLAREAKNASRTLATLSSSVRDAALIEIARRLRHDSTAILEANQKDIAAAPGFGLSAAATDRLRLDAKRLEEMAKAVDEVRSFPDPLGRVIDGGIRPNGLEVSKVRVPLGVVFFIYESRPNVTTDAAALCIKSGNAVILRGGKEARHSNIAIGRLVSDALQQAGVPPAAVTMVDNPDRQVVGEMLLLNSFIDVAIPRGGEDLIRRVADEATMPVMKHFKGICHVYLDASADEAMSIAIVENSKCQRPGVCNAAECLLVHRDAASRLLPSVARRLQERGVELRGCSRTREWVPNAVAANESDFGAEFLDLIMAVKVVDSIDDAIDHIARYGSAHTDTIVTNDVQASRRFIAAVDSSAVMVNASTRFNDGGQFGLGAEIGISTDKYHARGPCGLNELTSYKYVVQGNGQVRG